MKHENRDQQRDPQPRDQQQHGQQQHGQPQQGQQPHGQPHQDQKPREKGKDREMSKAPDRDMGKNRNEEETGEPIQLHKEGKHEGEGRGPQLP